MKTILYYGAPAYGHINPSLAYIKSLIESDYRVIYYATDNFKEKIEATGATYVAYPETSTFFLSTILDATKIAKHPWSLAVATLSFIDTSLDELIRQAEVFSPDLIIHDSMASIGRFIAQKLALPAICFNTFISVTRVFKPSWWAYAKYFSKPLLFDASAIFHYLKLSYHVKRKFQIQKTDLLNLFHNKEKLNIVTFSSKLHPDWPLFDTTYFFAGPLARLTPQPSTAFPIPATPFIYVTLGTVVTSAQLIDNLITQLSQIKMKVILVIGKNKLTQSLPEHIDVHTFVPQLDILPKAKLLITTGGMNTINEAIHAQIPIIVLPFLGEQKINADQIEKLGLGIYLKNINKLNLAINQSLSNLSSPSQDKIDQLSETRLDQAIKLTQQFFDQD